MKIDYYAIAKIAEAIPTKEKIYLSFENYDLKKYLLSKKLFGFYMIAL